MLNECLNFICCLSPTHMNIRLKVIGWFQDFLRWGLGGMSLFPTPTPLHPTYNERRVWQYSIYICISWSLLISWCRHCLVIHKARLDFFRYGQNMKVDLISWHLLHIQIIFILSLVLTYVTHSDETSHKCLKIFFQICWF